MCWNCRRFHLVWYVLKSYERGKLWVCEERSQYCVQKSDRWVIVGYEVMSCFVLMCLLNLLPPCTMTSGETIQLDLAETRGGQCKGYIVDLWRNGLFVTPCIKSLYSKMKLTGSHIVCMLSSHYTRYNTCVINKKEGTKTITLHHPITLINTSCMNQRNHHYMAIQFISSYRDGCVNSLSYPTLIKIPTLIHISNHVDHTQQ